MTTRTQGEPETAAMIPTPLTLTRTAIRLVDDVCSCGGNQSRSVWRKPGDMRNQHRDDCPAVRVLSRVRWIEAEARADERNRIRVAVEGLPGMDVQVDRDYPPLTAIPERMAYSMPPATVTIRTGAGSLVDRAAVLRLLGDE